MHLQTYRIPALLFCLISLLPCHATLITIVPYLIQQKLMQAIKLAKITITIDPKIDTIESIKQKIFASNYDAGNPLNLPHHANSSWVKRIEHCNRVRAVLEPEDIAELKTNGALRVNLQAE